LSLKYSKLSEINLRCEWGPPTEEGSGVLDGDGAVVQAQDSDDVGTMDMVLWIFRHKKEMMSLLFRYKRETMLLLLLMFGLKTGMMCTRRTWRSSFSDTRRRVSL